MVYGPHDYQYHARRVFLRRDSAAWGGRPTNARRVRATLGMDEVIVHEESDVRYEFFVVGDEIDTSELEHDVQKRKHYIQSTILDLYDGITVEVRPIIKDMWQDSSAEIGAK